MTKTYEKIIETYLKDTNAYGNIYFARHFDWQGIIREAFFTQCVRGDLFSFFLITKRASIEFINQTYPCQVVRGTLNTSNLRHCSVDLVITFYDKETNRIVSKGAQTIVFAHIETQKMLRIPAGVSRILKEYTA